MFRDRGVLAEGQAIPVLPIDRLDIFIRKIGAYEDHGRLAGLAAQDCGLDHLPGSFWKLRDLRMLALGENYFASLPDRFDALDRLTHLLVAGIARAQ